MAAPADMGIGVTGLALLRVGFCRQTMTVTNPRKGVISGLARMTLYTRRIFVTHAALLRVRPISKPMFLLVISGVVGRIRGLVMAHDTVFWSILAVVANKTILHLRLGHVAIEVFPFGYAGMATAAFKLFMLFMGKNELFSEAFAGTQSLAGFLEMTKAAIAFFPSLKVALKTAFFAGAPESIVNFDFLRKNTADA